MPDPYYGGAGGFDEVFELVQAACEGLLEQIRRGRDGRGRGLGRGSQARARGSCRSRARRCRRACVRRRALAAATSTRRFAWCWRTAATAFVKTRADAAAGEYAAEAAGLRWLAEPGALRVPRVLDVGERYLALEWVGSSRAGVEPVGPERHGRRGARTRPRGDPRGGRAVLRRTAAARRRLRLAGAARTSRRRTGRRSTRERRLLPLARLAREHGALSRSGERGGGARVRAARRAVRPGGAAGAAARRPVVGQRDGRRAMGARG